MTIDPANAARRAMTTVLDSRGGDGTSIVEGQFVGRVVLVISFAIIQMCWDGSLIVFFWIEMMSKRWWTE